MSLTAVNGTIFENYLPQRTPMLSLVKGFILSVMFSTIISSCQKTPSSQEVQQKDMKNETYGTNSAQKIDVYLPAERDTINTKVILFIHGGSWSGGDKNEFDSAIAAIRTRLPDYAMFSMNYRLAGNAQNRFPSQMQDIDSAIDFITNNARTYKINPTKIALVGASAGAHLALLQAYKNNADGRIKAVVDLFGPTDLVSLYNDHPVPAASQPVLVNFLGATPATNPTLYRDASPINFVTTHTVPTLIFHGDADYIVPSAQSIALKNKLLAANVKVEMTLYNGESHGWYGSNLLDTYAKTIAFIQQNVK
jgi:acetyl esterase/lipase